MKLLRLAIIAGALALSGGFAQAQTGSQYNAKLTITPVQNLPQGALVPVAGAAGGVQSYPAPVGLVGSIGNEQVVVPLTAFTITPNNNTTLLFLNPAGTLATGTITFPASPSDGETFCWLSTQTQTAVTMTANTGQSVVGTGVTAGVAGTQYCWTYLAPTLTWYRKQ